MKAPSKKSTAVNAKVRHLQCCRWHGNTGLSSFCCLPNLRSPAKFSENSNLAVQGHPRSSILMSHMQLPISHYASPTVFEILAHLITRFPTSPCLTPPSGGTPWDTNVMYTSQKVHLIGYNSVADIWQYESIFIRLAVIGSQICEIPRNSETIRGYSRSRSSKCIDLGVNRKSICGFLLVLNSNFGQ